MPKSLELLFDRRFWPLFWTQFLGAMNDNFFKNAMALLILYELATAGGATLVTAAAGVFILPFFLFSSLAGQCADRFERAGLTKKIKMAEIIIMTAGATSLFAGNITALFAVLFLMGTQSTFFGPIKYGILPDILRRDELMAGNALIEAGTFLAILLGTIAGGLMILQEFGVETVSIGVLLMAALGWSTSLRIQTVPIANQDLPIEANILRSTWALIKELRAERSLWLAALGVSWFWFVGAVFMTQVPNLTKEVIGGNEQTVTLFLAAFSIGIGIGSFLASKLTQGRITVAPVPLAAIGMAVFAIDLYVAAANYADIGASRQAAGAALIGPGEFLSDFAGWRIFFDLVAVSIAGGLYVVPLFTAIQAWADPKKRARTIAGVNVINALFMTGSAIITLILFNLGADVPMVLGLLGLANIAAAIIIAKLLPQELLRSCILTLFKLCFRLKINGLEHLSAGRDRRVIVVNHASFLDAPILLAILPDKPVFAINTEIAKRWWLRPLLPLCETFAMDPTNPLATKELIAKVKAGRPLVIFPEGRLSVTGNLMKIYDGPAMIADKADADLLPVRLAGVERSFFSRLQPHQVKRTLFPKIEVTFQPPQPLRLPAGLAGKKRREAAGLALYDVMSDLIFQTSLKNGTLFEAIWDGAKISGFGRTIVEDPDGNGFSYRRLFAGAALLGERFERHLAGQDRAVPVGLMLPNTKAVAASFLGLQLKGRIPAMLNFTSGGQALNAAIQTAQVKTVITSKRFVEMADLSALVGKLQADILYLEDVAGDVTAFDRVRALLTSRKAGRDHQTHRPDPDATAVILFTSGSEAAAKGVALSHRNILSNIAQVQARTDLGLDDRFFNALPNFHSFGLTGGLILPLVAGIPVFLYPSPLHYRFIPEMVYGANSTVLFGTDTFLQGYGRNAHAYDFRSLRYVIAGAEPVKAETRAMWMEKFGQRILEGYGVTECAPSLALNTEMHNRTGTVGRLLPAIDHRLDAVEGIEDGGRLWVKGPNIMRGYIMPDRPGEIQAPEAGWHDTGDIVSIDAEGFVTIKGRAKRFAKIGGEMISLTAVERLAQELWPDHEHAVVARPHARKGEELVLVTTKNGAERSAIQARVKATSRSELMLPASIIVRDTLPLLGTGKRNYPAIQAMVSELVAG